MQKPAQPALADTAKDSNPANATPIRTDRIDFLIIFLLLSRYSPIIEDLSPLYTGRLQAPDPQCSSRWHKSRLLSEQDHSLRSNTCRSVEHKSQSNSRLPLGTATKLARESFPTRQRRLIS